VAKPVRPAVRGTLIWRVAAAGPRAAWCVFDHLRQARGSAGVAAACVRQGSGWSARACGLENVGKLVDPVGERGRRSGSVGILGPQALGLMEQSSNCVAADHKVIVRVTRRLRVSGRVASPIAECPMMRPPNSIGAAVCQRVNPKAAGVGHSRPKLKTAFPCGGAARCQRFHSGAFPKR